MKHTIAITLSIVALGVGGATHLGAQRGLSPAAVAPPPTLTPQDYPADQISAGEPRFVARCGFCHGRDAGGGEGGPDLTRSGLVAADVYGDRIGGLLRNGLAAGPSDAHALEIPAEELRNIVAFVHDRKQAAERALGGRQFVEAEDIRTGSAADGRAYFNGRCSRCHSATGDLAGIATRFQGLDLMRRILYPAYGQPSPAPPTLTVTLPNGTTVTGPLVYGDEFRVALDADGQRREFATDAVEYSIDDPFEFHFELLGILTDKDIHDLYAYLETLR